MAEDSIFVGVEKGDEVSIPAVALEARLSPAEVVALMCCAAVAENNPVIGTPGFILRIKTPEHLAAVASLKERGILTVDAKYTPAKGGQKSKVGITMDVDIHKAL